MSDSQTTSAPGNGQRHRIALADTRGVALKAAREALRAVPGSIVVSDVDVREIAEAVSGIRRQVNAMCVSHLQDDDDMDRGALATILGYLEEIDARAQPRDVSDDELSPEPDDGATDAESAEAEGVETDPMQFRLSGGATHNSGLGDMWPDAEVGDVVMTMLRAPGEEEKCTTYGEAAVQSAIDDLGVLILACDSASTVDELQRVLERIRSRLLAGRWIDSKLGLESEAAE